MKRSHWISALAVIVVGVFALFNGLMINWKHNLNNHHWSSYWHPMGAILRVFLLIIICLANWGNWLALAFWVNTWLVVSWPGYDVLINVVMQQSLFRIGDTAKTDQWARNHPIAYWGLKSLFVISNLALGIFLIK